MSFKPESTHAWCALIAYPLLNVSCTFVLEIGEYHHTATDILKNGFQEFARMSPPPEDCEFGQASMCIYAQRPAFAELDLDRVLVNHAAKRLMRIAKTEDCTWVIRLVSTKK